MKYQLPKPIELSIKSCHQTFEQFEPSCQKLNINRQHYHMLGFDERHEVFP